MKSYILSVIVIIFLIQVNIAFAQYADFPIKEQYDATETKIVGTPYHYLDYSSTTTPANRRDNLGDRMPYVLESYIKMYETTKDKAYLIRFIHHAISMQEERV